MAYKLETVYAVLSTARTHKPITKPFDTMRLNGFLDFVHRLEL
jgi:hypothetical protein